MRIKKYTASSMKEALLKIKKDFGDDAMILKTRKLPRRIFSLNEQETIEVTAAIDEGKVSKAFPLPPLKVNNPGVYQRPRAVGKEFPASAGAAFISDGNDKEEMPQNPVVPMITRMDTQEQLRMMELKEEIREMKSLLKSILRTGQSCASGGFAGEWAILYKRLVDSEIRTTIAESLIRKMIHSSQNATNALHDRFITAVGDSFPVSGPLRLKSGSPLVVAFVGPTGAGKTTTIAKLVSYYSLHKKGAVSIITADTYRIAAIEQIRAFADIVGVRLHVVFNPQEAQDALTLCENDDIVFVDTAGRSQKNNTHMKELASLVEVLRPDDTHLVLSATTKDSDIHDVIKRYREVPIHHLLFTKLDETVKIGNIFNAVNQYAIPVSYFTIGQNVPEDIEIAQPVKFVQRLLTGSSL